MQSKRVLKNSQNNSKQKTHQFVWDMANSGCP